LLNLKTSIWNWSELFFLFEALDALIMAAQKLSGVLSIHCIAIFTIPSNNSSGKQGLFATNLEQIRPFYFVPFRAALDLHRPTKLRKERRRDLTE
jgi:hypothetical protein